MIFVNCKKRLSLLLLSAFSLVGEVLQVPLSAALAPPEGLDAAWVLYDIQATGPRYTDLLRRFIPGEGLEESLINYLLDLGYPDFEELEPHSSVGFFLAKKEPASASRLACIALKLREDSSLRKLLPQQGWTVYEYQGWSLVSLASADSFSKSQAKAKNTWVNYLQTPQEQDIACMLDCEGLSEEIQTLYASVLEGIFERLVSSKIENSPESTSSYAQRPLALALKQEIASLKTISLGLNYIASEDSLSITLSIKPRDGTALAEFFSTVPLGTHPSLGGIDLPEAFFKAELNLNPQALKDYLGHLQSCALALESVGWVNTPTRPHVEGSAWLALGLYSLASFEKSWNGQSLVYCFLPHKEGTSSAFNLDYMLLQGGTFSQADIWAIAQDKASYLPHFWQSLRPGQDSRIQAHVQPSPIPLGDGCFDALELCFQPLGSQPLCLQGLSLYSGAKNNYGLFTNRKSALEASLGVLDSLARIPESLPEEAGPKAAPEEVAHKVSPEEAALKVSETPQALKDRGFLRALCNLLAFYPGGSNLQDLRFVPQQYIARIETFVDAGSLKCTLNLPLRGIELLLLPQQGDSSALEQALN